VGSHDLFLIFANRHMSQDMVKLKIPAHAVRVVHSMQSLPNYFGLLSSVSSSSVSAVTEVVLLDVRLRAFAYLLT